MISCRQYEMPSTTPPSFQVPGDALGRRRTRPNRTSTLGSLQKELAPKNAFVPRTRRGGGAAHAVPPPAHTARADRKRKNERTTQDTHVYGGPDARSLGARAGS